MADVTNILNRISDGDQASSDELMQVLYSELRTLARQKMASEKAGQTLQPTALVHEAFIRLVSDSSQRWDHRGHFFAAAAEAMRRVLVESARKKSRIKRGGKDQQRVPLSIAQPETSDELNLVELDDALDQLAVQHERKATLVKLRFFAGLTIEEAAAALGISVGTANNDWAFAKSWLQREMS